MPDPINLSGTRKISDFDIIWLFGGKLFSPAAHRDAKVGRFLRDDEIFLGFPLSGSAGATFFPRKFPEIRICRSHLISKRISRNSWLGQVGPRPRGPHGHEKQAGPLEAKGKGAQGGPLLEY